MRVLFLAPSQFQSWEREPMNHEVRLPMLASGLIAEHRTFDYRTSAQAQGRAAMLAELRELVRGFAPDVIVYGNTLRDWRLSPEELASLRQATTKILGLLSDTYDRPTDQEMEFFLALDGIVIGDSLYAYARYRLLAEHHHTGKSVIFLPGHQVLPEIFHPGGDAKAYDVSHIGTVYGGRQDFIESLAAALPSGRTVAAFGGLFERTEVRRVDNLVLYDYAASERFLPLDEYARVMRQSHCCLSLQTDAGAPRLRGKTFEIMASAALCAVQETKQYDLILPSEGCLSVASPEDAACALGDLLDDPGELVRRARIGFEWFRDSFDLTAFWIGAFAALAEGRSPELREANTRRAYDGLKADLFAHYDGPPSEDSLMKLIFS